MAQTQQDVSDSKKCNICGEWIYYKMFSVHQKNHTNQEILTKAIQKAIDNGWDIVDKYESNNFDVQTDIFTGNLIVAFIQTGDKSGILTRTMHWTEIVFNQDFAKALWGEAITSKYDLATRVQIYSLPMWQYILQQMVIADDPIKYLGENLLADNGVQE